MRWELSLARSVRPRMVFSGLLKVKESGSSKQCSKPTEPSPVSIGFPSMSMIGGPCEMRGGGSLWPLELMTTWTTLLLSSSVPNLARRSLYCSSILVSSSSLAFFLSLVLFACCLFLVRVSSCLSSSVRLFLFLPLWGLEFIASTICFLRTGFTTVESCCSLLDFPLPPFSGTLAESVVFSLVTVLFRPETLVGTSGAAFFLLLPDVVGKSN
mmetsp:Transcript_605/g.997  ORF Transcript_605/g.997 Transcript_605/m.997 type:complete len:212 (+) Transcript_605:628-1263(+)